MAIREELLLFVRDALERGLGRSEIEAALLRAGWRPEEVAKSRWSIASLIVAFPIFMIVTSSLTRAAARDVERRSSKVRQWLTYLTLLVAAAVMAGDLVALIYNLLGGELTARFLLEVAVVGAIAAGVFGYFLWDLRGEEREDG